jgi:hypothetical protein
MNADIRGVLRHQVVGKCTDMRTVMNADIRGVLRHQVVGKCTLQGLHHFTPQFNRYARMNDGSHTGNLLLFQLDSSFRTD